MDYCQVINIFYGFSYEDTFTEKCTYVLYKINIDFPVKQTLFRHIALIKENVHFEKWIETPSLMDRVHYKAIWECLIQRSSNI